MEIQNKFIKQTKEVKLYTVTKPRTFLQWENTEYGRDKLDCYERIEGEGYIYWVNQHNKSSYICCGSIMYDILEEMYKNYSGHIDSVESKYTSK